jgi:SAM-dependent methyltransferase
VVVDLDSSAEAATRAKGHDFIRGRFEDVVLQERFDLVLMLNLIEHVDDPLAVLRKAARVLTPTGVILVKAPNYESGDARLFRHRNWGGYHCPRHWVIFHRASLTSLVERAQLTVADLRYTQGAPFWTVSVLGLLADRGWARVSLERPVHRHPLYAPLAAGFAALDFVRRPFVPLSQMILALRPA